MGINIVSSQDIQKLGELVKDIKTAMLSTVDPDGKVYSRPMATLPIDSHGDLWFFTQKAKFWADALQADSRVHLNYVGANGHSFVTIGGAGEVTQDRQKMAELWNPSLKPWFARELGEPDLALIRVTVQEVEYWNTPSSKAVQLIGFIKALAKGKPFETEGSHHLVIGASALDEPRKPDLQS